MSRAFRSGVLVRRARGAHQVTAALRTAQYARERKTLRLEPPLESDPQTGGFVMLGKTFKGLTDAMLRWQTERLQQLEDHRDRWTVYVRPELVVEVKFDGVQRSPRYPGGVALRFARVVRYREDKRPQDADTIDTVRALCF